MSGLVSLVGPPAAGKTTVSTRLAARGDARVFRLREFAHAYRQRPGLDPALFATSDPLGWFTDATAQVLLEAALLGQGASAGPVVLESLPGTVTQLRVIDEIAHILALPVMMIELSASDEVVLGRSRARRACFVCEPDPCSDPHRPAVPAAEAADTCAACGNRVVRRRGDDPPTFTLKLRRFRTRIADIRREAAALGVPCEAVDADDDRRAVLCQVTAALTVAEFLTPGAAEHACAEGAPR